MLDFEIQPARTPEEINTVIDFIVEHQMRRFNVPTTKAEIIAEDIGREVYWFSAQHANKIVGAISVKIWPKHRHHIGIHYWVVEEVIRGQGIGNALLGKVYEIARQKNESLIFAAVRPTAIIVYEACGFTRVADMVEIPYKGMMLVPYERRIEN